MSDETKVRDLFAAMQKSQIDVDGRRFRVDREKIVATILRAPKVFAELRAARARRHGMLAMAAGVLLVVGAGGWLLARRPVVIDRAEEALQLSDVRGQVMRAQGASHLAIAPGVSASVSAEGELVTAANSEVSVHTAGGLDVKLFENSRVVLSDLKTGQSAIAVRLETGAIRCQVPHLAEGHHFSIVTPDATIVVRGTTFRVSVGGMVGASRTCVVVEQGVVSVEGALGETRVSESQSWGCDAASGGLATASPVVQLPEVPQRSGHPPPLRVGSESPRESAKAAPGTLTEENRLFQSGLAAERRGDARVAIASFEILLSRYAQSPLAADARVALARVERAAKGAP